MSEKLEEEWVMNKCLEKILKIIQKKIEVENLPIGLVTKENKNALDI